jgi:lactate racemase
MAVMELVFRPGVTTQVEIDDGNLLFCATGGTLPAGETRPFEIPDQAAVVEEALDDPIGAERLEALLKPDDRVVIMVDDITRPTPAAQILPHILNSVHGADIPIEAVTIFMAIGTHRLMTEEELRAKLGDEVRERYRIIHREYRDGDFVDLGQTESGTPIFVDR